VTGGETASPGAAGQGIGGSIYDLGYRGYAGPRLGRRHAIRALLVQTLRVAYGVGRGGRAKLAPVILGGLATIPAIIGVGVVALARQAGMPPNLEDASPVRHDTYYGLITTLVVLFCAAQVPEILGRDQRHQLLSLYFSRALRREDYALARVAGIILAILVFVLLPQAIIFLGLVLSASDIGAEFGREARLLGPILGQAVVLSVLLGSLSAVVAAFTPRRVYATTAIIVVLAVTPIVGSVLVGLGVTDLARLAVLLSPADILEATNAKLFGTTSSNDLLRAADLPGELYLVGAAVISVVAIALLVRRFRTIAA